VEEPYAVLQGYWSWRQFIQPVPRYLTVLLGMVRSWVIDGSEPSRQAISSFLDDKRALIEGELRSHDNAPDLIPLLDACLALDAMHRPERPEVPVRAMRPELAALVRQYERLPKAVAWKVWRTAPTQLDLDELTGIANAALVASAARWPAHCAKHGYSPTSVEYFQYVATLRIRGAVYDALRSEDWVTRKIRRNAKALLAAGQETGASLHELSQRTGLSRDDVQETLLAMTQAPVSLELQEVEFSAPEQAIESQVAAKQILNVCADAIQTLSEEKQNVLVLKYYCDMSLDEIAEQLELPKSRISALHIEAVLAVHAAMRAYVDDVSEAS
jgi:RNA polymerase sigma factor for flagellar operon FliA